MSQAFVDKKARELEAITTQLVWRQWRAIDGSLNSSEPWHSIVDPEALILASLHLVDREPRIHGVMFSWVEANADLLSVQHLKNLQKTYPPTSHARVAEFARHARALSRHPKWNALSADVDETFPALPDVRRAIRAAPGHTANLLLRLRMALGVGVKADAMGVVLGNERPVSIRDLADILSYTLVGTRSALLDLSRAGFTIPIKGKPTTFSAPHAQWQALLGLKIRPRWVTWHHWFAFVIDYITWCETARAKHLGEYAIDVKIRELVARHGLFFRYAGHELDPVAFQSDVGSYAAVLDSLIDWARRQERYSEA